MLAEFFPSEASLLDLQGAIFSLCCHIVFPVCVCVLGSSSYKETSHIGLECILITLFSLLTSLKALYSQSEVLGIRISTYDFGRDTFQSITVCVT